MITYPQLPDHSLCCGCGACIDACNKSALSLKEDKDGFYNVILDKNKCIGCKVCEKQCHILNQNRIVRSSPKKVKPLAGWSLDEDIIRRSATGGIFTQIAYTMLQEGNTCVYGAALTDQSSVEHIEVLDVCDLWKLQNSKYQQSYAVGIYRKVRDRLKEGKRVLFSGTPCMVAALQSYLGNKSALSNQLYTIEIICHGVPTSVLHRNGLKINKAAGLYAYRNKVEPDGWLYGGNNKVGYKMKDGSVKVMPNRVSDFLFRSYLTMSFLRPSCYACRYANIHRVADITIGDFWGFHKSARKDEYFHPMGSSIILPNTQKGEMMIQSCPNLHTVDVAWRDFLPYNQNLYMPSNKAIFKCSGLVHYIEMLPLCIRRIVYQNGFTNPAIDKLYQKIYRILYKNLIRKKETESLAAANNAMMETE
ncbi:MAG: Coenzyme F420 hydrogenase/dehydrogenase, beta subunit C-terminal domain [Fibrobacter sp.]|nr:Coenzyme F420 hydrogenase/dehydrogenase, beta subunit C-terminal domain [Fibrobacter sp.]